MITEAWQMLHPKMTIEQLGLVPEWFYVGDDRKVKEIIEENYRHGGGFQPIKGFVLHPENGSIKYPGDPVMKPLARMKHGSEVVYFYDCAILAVVQPDGSFEVTRVD